MNAFHSKVYNISLVLHLVEEIGVLTDPKGSGLNIVTWGIGKQLYLSKKLDGNEIWKIHKPPIMGNTDFPKKALNIESMKYPGNFLMVTKDLKRVIIGKPTDSESSMLFKNVFQSIKCKARNR